MSSSSSSSSASPALSGSAGGRPPLLVIAGPTASGKSRLALDLVQALRTGDDNPRPTECEIVNADASQVYRELSILTARPGSDDLAVAPHHIYGVLPAAEPCSAGRWRELALEAIADIHARGNLPVIVGGTGLYLRALLQGLAAIPPIPAAVRDAVSARLEAEGPAALHAELKRRDPAGAARLAPADRQRIRRALEVLEATGRPIGDWQRDAAATAVPFEALTFVIDPPRDELRAACAARFAGMMAAGALDEVRRLRSLALPPEVPALKALGVRELGAHLDGELSLEEAVDRAVTATVQYAKRQQTWFRHQMPAAIRLAAGPGYAQFSERIFQEFCTKIRSFLLTARS